MMDLTVGLYDFFRNNQCINIGPFMSLEEAQLRGEKTFPNGLPPDITIQELPPPEVPESWVRLRNTVKAGMIVENCSCHAVLVKSVNYESGDMKCVSIHTGKDSNCDLYHCGIVVLSPVEIEHKKQLYATGGNEALVEDWRSSLELDND